MQNKFICPRCEGYLNVGKHIVLTATTQKDKNAGLVFLNQEIGNYTIETNPEFKVNEGEIYEFSCPICHEKLATDIHHNLSRIIMIDEKKNKYEILFSKIAGEKSTYKIIGESIEIFGDHHSNYIDFINLSLSK